MSTTPIDSDSLLTLSPPETTGRRQTALQQLSLSLLEMTAYPIEINSVTTISALLLSLEQFISYSYLFLHTLSPTDYILGGREHCRVYGDCRSPRRPGQMYTHGCAPQGKAEGSLLLRDLCGKRAENILARQQRETETEQES